MAEINVIPWFAWIPIVAIIGYFLHSIVETVVRSRQKVAEAALADQQQTAELAETNARLLARLDGIDGRLQTIEKTLTDIP
ncbi:hypothetical protein [Actinotalea sp. K2]|uniref:hypothetical protein n=1 Tax=Actinotalea sp. K2 TaxID=2939438 RepID=UPI0020172E95|nr:hypothetical protein [Actinotalea sp. K2]MCL3862817.1 hypothetical protein [Actinotalea sp. K2]